MLQLEPSRFGANLLEVNNSAKPATHPPLLIVHQHLRIAARHQEPGDDAISPSVTTAIKS